MRVDWSIKGFKHRKNGFRGSGAHLCEPVAVNGLQIVKSSEIFERIANRHFASLTNRRARLIGKVKNCIVRVDGADVRRKRRVQVKPNEPRIFAKKLRNRLQWHE